MGRESHGPSTGKGSLHFSKIAFHYIILFMADLELICRSDWPQTQISVCPYLWSTGIKKKNHQGDSREKSHHLSDSHICACWVNDFGRQQHPAPPGKGLVLSSSFFQTLLSEMATRQIEERSELRGVKAGLRRSQLTPEPARLQS